MQQAQALEALLALVRNMCLNDSGVTTRNLCVKAHLGVHLGTLSLSLSISLYLSLSLSPSLTHTLRLTT